MMGRPVGDNAWLMGEKGGGPSIPAWLASKYFHQRPRRQDDNVKADSVILNTLSRNIGKYPLHQSGELPNSYFLRVGILSQPSGPPPPRGVLDTPNKVMFVLLVQLF